MRNGMGWIRDYPDWRDYTLDTDHDHIKAIKQKINSQTSLPTIVDLRPHCPPIKNQGHLGACTAHAVEGLIEYYQKNTFGTYIDGSRLFIYKTARSLLGMEGDSGATLRISIAALKLFGVPPEIYWPYDVRKFDDDPTPFVYALAQNYQAITYYRLDPPHIPPEQILFRIKQHLAKGFPAVFGFVVFSSISQATKSGYIPVPHQGDRKIGGHAVMAVGYNDSDEHLIIKNSWGTEWGDNGYGYLPYEYVMKGLAVDWWVMTKEEWVDLRVFI